jgi:SAM-dependent methyltransferase
MPEWFEDESFWIDLFPFLFSEEQFQRAERELQQVLSLLRFQGRSVLDLCCGPGRFSLPLAQQGFSVTGVDRSPNLLDTARARAETAGLEIEWVLSDMRSFSRPAAFDLILSMFTSFGYFDDKEEDLLVLQRMFRNLKPGGCCLIELVGKEILANIFQPTTSQRLANGSILVERHEVFDSWTRIRNEWILIDGEVAKTFRFHHTIYSGQELRDRLESAGFQDVCLYGNLDGDPYGLESQRLIAVGGKA